MPEIRFFCPQCLSTLKLNHAAPEGKSIKCPRCHAISPFPSESAVSIDSTGAAKPAARGLPTPMPMRAPSLHHAAPVEAIDVMPIDDEEAGPITSLKKKPKKKAYDAVPLFVAFIALAYAGLAAATYLGYFDEQIKSLLIAK